MIALITSTVAMAAPSSLHVKIDGMTCPACAKKVETQLTIITWIESVKISLDDSNAEIVVKTGKSISGDEIRQAIETAGYHVKNITIQ